MHAKQIATTNSYCNYRYPLLSVINATFSVHLLVFWRHPTIYPAYAVKTCANEKHVATKRIKIVIRMLHLDMYFLHHYRITADISTTWDYSIGRARILSPVMPTTLLGFCRCVDVYINRIAEEALTTGVKDEEDRVLTYVDILETYDIMAGIVSLTSTLELI